MRRRRRIFRTENPTWAGLKAAGLMLGAILFGLLIAYLFAKGMGIL